MIIKPEFPPLSSGMLLELPGPVLGLMLQDKASLSAAVEKALGALQWAQEPRYAHQVFAVC